MQVGQKRNNMFRLGCSANKTGCKVHVLLSEVCLNKTCNGLNKDTRGKYIIIVFVVASVPLDT